MTTAQAAFLGGMMSIFAILALAVYVLFVVAYWKIFTKMGVPGWKSIIPVYNEYILFKNVWDTKFFWIAFALIVIGGIVCGLDAGSTTTYVTNNAVVSAKSFGALYYVGQLIAAAGSIILLIAWWFLGKSFGHGVGFFIASIFFPFITTLYLGFNKDEYLGNTTK